jgi:hypothetical protein
VGVTILHIAIRGSKLVGKLVTQGVFCVCDTLCRCARRRYSDAGSNTTRQLQQLGQMLGKQCNGVSQPVDRGPAPVGGLQGYFKGQGICIAGNNIYA